MFKEALKITNNNIILTIPLIIFIYIFDLYSIFARYSVDSVFKLLLTSITILFMSAVFSAGWFYMVKNTISHSKKDFILDSDRSKASFNLLKTIPEGIGEFFLSFVGVQCLLFILQFILSIIVYFVGEKLIGRFDETFIQSLQTFTLNSTDVSNVSALIDKMTPEQIIFLGKWSLLWVFAISIFMYFLILWIPELIYKTKNPLIALFKSIAKLFGDFWKTIALFIVLWTTGFMLLFLNTFSLINPIAYLIINVLIFYFIVYCAVIIFLYYDKKYNLAEDEQ